MSTAPSVGLALIAKDEQDSLPALLESVRGAFDRVVLVDTGSTDKTVEIFEQWAADEVGAGRLGSYLSDTFDWVDDFAAARAYAHSFLGTDWEVWADCDDVIKGAHQLRALAARAAPEVAAFIASYAYAHDSHGNCVCILRRERLVRAGAGAWVGRVHEAQEIDGSCVQLPADLVEWVHRKQPDQVEPGRNLRILKAWNKEDADNPRVLGYLGTEHLVAGKPKTAIRYFRRYLKLKTGWDQERAQIHRKLSAAHLAQGEIDKAIASAFEAVRLLPAWPDSYLTLAEAHYQLGEHDKAIEWADEVLRRGMPDSLLILNPTDYTIGPSVVKAGGLAALGQIEAAVQLGEQVLGQMPDHPMRPTWEAWRAQHKRQMTAHAALSFAETLVAHDEQLKALAVLENVPHYVFDDAHVVALRSKLRERVNELHDLDGYIEHYETGGSQPEDMVPDDQVLELGDRLPRCGFLLDGLNAQAA